MAGLSGPGMDFLESAQARIAELLRGGAFLRRIAQGDVVLAALVVGIVAMMIIPLPTLVLDILITGNISFAVVLLLTSLYITDALRFASFPSVLLIGTLFRLGLNVSSTRLILLQADAGTVVRSFGDFVVSGNLVVGAVVFLILTLIQFVVIAKGSERVAEVAARFTLDAMPGKQMAIDADVRAGALSTEAARAARNALQRESQLYGSMDGAMKFVKGDAIAGILITLVNIVGGLAIGVVQRGLPAGEAGQIYSILTIGDGLVSQIPALLISTAAGIVVTRVASEEGDGNLGREIGTQLLAQPRALGIASVLLFALALVPGLPMLPFIVLSGALGALAHRAGKRDRIARKHHGQGGTSERSAAGSAGRADPSLRLESPSSLTLEVGSGLVSLIDTQSEGQRLATELIPGLREMLYADLGLLLPGVHVREGTGLATQESYRIWLFDVPMADGTVDLARHIVLADQHELEALGLRDIEEVSLPALSDQAKSVPASAAMVLKRSAFEQVDPATQIVLHLGLVAREHAADLLGIQETQELLDRLEETHPALVQEVVPKLIPIQTLADILRRLVAEGLSIRSLREVLECIAEWAPVEGDPLVLAEYVRTALRRQISFRYAPTGSLDVCLLDPQIEDVIRESVQRTDRGSYLALTPELSQDIIAAIVRNLADLSEDRDSPVILTQREIRRFVRRLIEEDLPLLPVLSFNELVPSIEIRPAARITVGI